MMRSSSRRRPYFKLFVRPSFRCRLLLFSYLTTSRDDGGFETFRVFPSGGRKIGIGFVRVFDEGLAGLSTEDKSRQ